MKDTADYKTLKQMGLQSGLQLGNAVLIAGPQAPAQRGKCARVSLKVKPLDRATAAPKTQPAKSEAHVETMKGMANRHTCLPLLDLCTWIILILCPHMGVSIFEGAHVAAFASTGNQ